MFNKTVGNLDPFALAALRYKFIPTSYSHTPDDKQRRQGEREARTENRIYLNFRLDRNP